mgnify:CR=1 FL=1
MAGVHTGADETVADIRAGRQRSLHVGAVEGIDIHGVVSFRLLGSFDQLAHHLVAVRTAGVLGADADLPLGAGKPVANASHIHGDCLRHTGGKGTGTAVTHFLIDGHVGIGLSFGNDVIVRQISEELARICKIMKYPQPAIFLEPGRSIVADSGITMYTVGSIKQITDDICYVAIDGGMTDNPRYTLYQAEHTFLLANRMSAPVDFKATIAGRCCESGDILQENVSMPSSVTRGDVIAVLTTGAYNYSMASNYNRVPRPPVVMIGAQGPNVAVRRESLDDIVEYDA